MKFSLNVLLVVLAAGLLSLTAAAQTTPEVKCGMMVRSNLTLTADLNCPSLPANGAALIVPVSGVTVNLNGFAVRGSGTGAGIVVPGADNVTVTNGEVTGFGVGIMVMPAGPDRPYSTTITHMRAAQNTAVGIYLQNARFAEVSECEATHNTTGGILVYEGTDYSVVSDNLVYGNAFSGIIVGCDSWKLDPKGGAASACDGRHANDNVIERNAVIGNGWTNAITVGNSGIMLIMANRNVVQENFVMDNNTTNQDGQLNVTYGIMIASGADNVAAQNRVSNNGIGIVAGMFHSTPATYATNTVVTGNTVLHNASSGIIVMGEGVNGTMIRDNTAIANGHAEKTGFPVQCRSGIRVNSPGTASLMNNRAYDNYGYGLHVETKDITAQFGNLAKRNGQAEQCAGAACK